MGATKYTIHYQYGTYSGDETVYLSDQEVEEEVDLIARMWKRLKKYMTLGMAYQSAHIIKTEYIDDDK
jgi:hypothetical protein